ncbi:1,4-dihydroxy-2-naphthoate polyprenyltransferase [Porphyromonadaceae bacterium OttesenSCG-928-L07]|nr:1,4-dihydroxy-2-naphthoate polyprenyltransferase [Porphyromonadaceae bacterium OttesenSCG-928-L07]MDL2251670.1 1,4-dihydroxy-2-naphthoate polyprenyltransferase [Odoribacter sp. OttesenSCG-928-J03]
MENIKNNSWKAWVLAVRPHTLPASASPVIIGSALAVSVHSFHWIPALICLVFALVAQIVSNFANDYFDYKKGIDGEERLGPKRAVAEGWIKPKTMLKATLGLLLADAILGLSLIYYGGWQLIIIGVLIVLFALAYSGGPYPLSSRGLGDVCVLIFFGIVPVGFTYYVQALEWTPAVTFCGIAAGLVITNILVANNYRDRDTDKAAGKKTTIVLFGEKFGRYFYLFNGFAAVLCCQYFWCTDIVWAAIFPLFFLPIHFFTWRRMVRIYEGKGLVGILKESARNVLLFSILLSAGLIY